MTEDQAEYGGFNPVLFGGEPERAALTPIDKARAVIERFGPDVKAVRRRAFELDVTNDRTHKEALNIVGGAKELTKALKKKLAELIEEPEAFVKKLKGFVKVFTDDLDAADKSCRQKIAEYQYKIELDRRKAEEEARKATQALQEKLNAEAKQSGIEAPVIQPVIVPKKTGPTRTDEGVSGSIRMAWTFEVLDETKVPRDYMSLDTKKVNEAIKAGIREIAGLRIFEKPTSVVRI